MTIKNKHTTIESNEPKLYHQSMSEQSELIATDIESYLKVHEHKDMLRFLTCGSVDDGKSTLIGRLLYDSKMIFDDQMAAIEKDSKRFNTTNDAFDLALLVDGLQSEREQGITIDVAYRYFSTDKRKFIIADTPGHEQYTRNMATGASTCDLAIILIDARYGVQTQTRRHSFIVSLLGIKHVIVAVNKMDLVDFDQTVYQQIKRDYKKLANQLKFKDIRFVPISALNGDNVVNESKAMDWYPGATLMKLLNTIEIKSEKQFEPFRFQVQYVNRPNLDFRGFAGTVAAGDIRIGDTIIALPSKKESQIESIITFDCNDINEGHPNKKQETASAGQAVTLTLTDEIDISRGDMLVRPHQQPYSSDSFNADLVWMDETPLQIDRDYLIKLGTKTLNGKVIGIDYRVDVNSFEHMATQKLELNEIARCRFQLAGKAQFDSYDENRNTSAFIVIDKLTNLTVGGGMIVAPLEQGLAKKVIYSDFEIELNALMRKQYPHWQVVDISK